MVGGKKTSKSNTKSSKSVKESPSKKKSYQDFENEKFSQCLLLKDEDFNDSYDFKTPLRKNTACRSRLRNQISSIKETHSSDCTLPKNYNKQSISNSSIKSTSQPHVKNTKNRSRKISQPKNEDSNTQNDIELLPPKSERINLSQTSQIKAAKSQTSRIKSAKASSKLTKRKVLSEENIFDCDDEELLGEKPLCMWQASATQKSSLPTSQLLSQSLAASDDDNHSCSQYNVFSIYKAPDSGSASGKVVKEENSASLLEESEMSSGGGGSGGTYLRTRRKVCYKYSDKASKKHIPVFTSSPSPTPISPTLQSPISSPSIPILTSPYIPTIVSPCISTVSSLFMSAIPSPSATSAPYKLPITSPSVLTVSSPSLTSVTSYISKPTAPHKPCNILPSYSHRIPPSTLPVIPPPISHVLPSSTPPVTSTHVATVTSPCVTTVTSLFNLAVSSPSSVTQAKVKEQSRYNHDKPQLEEDNDFTDIQMKTCPTCRDDFPDLIFNEHVIHCLKVHFQLPQRGPFTDSTKHSQISRDEILAQKLHAELNKEATKAANDIADSEKLQCFVCKTELVDLTPFQRTLHINTCMDKSDNTKNLAAVSQSVVVCPMCGLRFKTFSLREEHFKTCSKVKANTRKRQPKSKTTSQNTTDEQLQLALAMSSSLQEDQNKQEQQLSRCIQNIKKDVFKELKYQKNKQSPLLVTVTAEQRQASNAGRVADIMNQQFEDAGFTKYQKWSSLAPTGSPTLWSKTSLKEESSSKLPFYVNSLMPPIRVDDTNISNRLKSLSRNSGSEMSQKAMASANGENQQPLIEPSQTVNILAELADGNSSCYADTSQSQAVEPNKVSVSPLLSSLSADLYRLVNNPSFSDVQFITAEGSKVFAHKLILQLRCPNILNRLSSAAEMSTINLSQVPLNILLLFLKYIYAGQLNINGTEAYHLMTLSQELDLPELVDACEKILKEDHDPQSSGFYLSPVKTVDNIANFFLESSDDDLQNQNNSSQPFPCDNNKTLPLENLNQTPPRKNNQSKSSVKVRSSRKFSKRSLSSSITSIDSGDQGNNSNYLLNQTMSANQEEANSDYPSKHSDIDEPDREHCSHVTLQEPSPHSNPSQNKYQTTRDSMRNKTSLSPSTSPPLSASCSLFNNNNSDNEYKNQPELDAGDLILDFSPVPYIEESVDNLEEAVACPSPKLNVINTQQKETIPQETVSNNVLDICDQLSNMSEELFSDAGNMDVSFDSLPPFISHHNRLENKSPCREENRQKSSVSSHEADILPTNSTQCMTPGEKSDEEFSMFSHTSQPDVEKNFNYLNPSSVFSQTQEVTETNQQIPNETQLDQSSQIQTKKRKRTSRSYSPKSQKKSKNFDNFGHKTKAEEQNLWISPLDSPKNVSKEKGSRRFRFKTKRGPTMENPNSSAEEAEQHNNESHCSIGSSISDECSQRNTTKMTPKRSPKTAASLDNSLYKNVKFQTYLANMGEHCDETFISKLSNFIQNDPELYRKILSNESLNFDRLKEKLEEFDIKCTEKDLLHYLDSQCIAYVLDKNKRDNKTFCSTPKKKKAKERIKTQTGFKFDDCDRSCVLVDSYTSSATLTENSLNSSNNCDNEHLKKAEQSHNVTNCVETLDLKTLSSNSSNPVCSADKSKIDETANVKLKKKFTFKKIAVKHKDNNVDNSDHLDRPISEAHYSKLPNSDHHQSNDNIPDVWDHFYDEHFNDSMTVNSPVPTQPKDKLEMSAADPECNADKTLSDDGCCNTSVVHTTHWTTEQSRFCHLSDSSGNSSLNLICNMDTSVCNMNTSVCNLNTSVCNLNTSVCNINTTVCNMDSTVCNMASTVCNMASSVYNMNAPVCSSMNAAVCNVATPVCDKRHHTATNISVMEQSSISSPFTPMPDYDNMSTPGLKEEMKKYGCKARPKKNMVKVLKDIFTKTHQYKTDSEFDMSRDTHNTTMNSKSNAMYSSSPLTVFDNSYDNDGVVVFDDSYSTDDVDKLSTSQLFVGEDLFSKLNNFIQNVPELYQKVLTYEPIDLEVLKQRLKDSNIKCSVPKLNEYLDNQCITFVQGKDKQTSRRNQRVKKRKV
ncbi:uncharacterized protein LOC115217132 [Argonauta hians]